MSALAARAAVRSRAAAWIAGQVSGYAMVACDPGMCAALQAQGIPAGLLLWTGAASPLGASLVVTSPPVSSQPADQYAPALIAGFGSGATRIEVRATEPGGAAAYESALRADLTARRAAGSQPLTIEFAAPSPPGLLTPVLEADLQPAPARDRESLVRAAGEGTNQMRGK